MDIGLECYISEHSGFCGQLKKFCEDFVVTEIDESGCLVELTSQEIQPDIDKDADNKCHSKVTAETAKNDDDDDKQHDNRLVTSKSCRNAEKTVTTDKDGSLPPTNKYFYEPADMTSPDTIPEAFHKLTGLVGEMKVLELKDMYTKMQTDAKTIILGCFNSKSDRAVIHLNTRMAFPGIKTETTNQNGVYSITANIDQVFLDFLVLFNDKVAVENTIMYRMKEMVSCSAWGRGLENLMRFCCCIDKNSPASVDLPFCVDKDKRTKIHRLLAKYFGSFLESKTFVSEKRDINKKSCIQIRMRQKKGSSRKGNTQRIAENKPSKNHRGKGEIYTRFVLKKENMETLEAIERLSRALGTHPSSFSFAGIKDKKAVTLQNVIVKGITPEQLSVVNNNASLSNMVVGNYRREKKPMRKGQHGGNAFRIIIRDVQLNLQEEDIRCKNAIYENVEEAVENVKKYGFVNYFGRQRFGQDDSPRADEIGLAMLQGDMVQAVNLLLRPSSKKDDTNDAKRYFQETSDVPGTLSRMPLDKTRECLILKSLHRHGQDLDGCTKAFFNIPYSMRLLYTHSYVSLLWNKMASYRIKKYGLSNIVEGDLVYDPSSSDLTSASVGSATPPSEDDREDNTDIHSTRVTPYYDERSKNLQTDEDIEKIHKDGPHNIATSIVKSQVQVVTEEDVRAARYTIRDLVLPIPGYNVFYPTNRLGHRYQQALEKDGLSSKSFRIRSLGMTLPGAYRKVIAVPLDLEYKWISTDDTKKEVGVSPGNTYPLKKHQTHTYSLPDKCNVNSGKNESYNKTERDDTNVSNMDDNDDLEGHEPCRKRLKHDDGETRSNCIENDMEISFQLQPSCYATVCLREIMKT